MSILIINYYPHDLTPYEKLYQSLDGPLILLTSKETIHTYPREDYEYVEAFESFPDNPAVIQRAIHLHQIYQFRRVIALHEFDLLRAAKLREYLGIEGQSLPSAINYRDKVIMKEKVAASGLRVPNHKRVNDVIDLLSFVEENGLPVIVKPIDGAGSIGTQVIKSEKELNIYIGSKADLNGLEVEEFINGTLHHVDGIVQNGKVVFISTAQYLGGNCIDFKEMESQWFGTYGSFQLHPSNPLAKRVFQFTKKVIAALDTPTSTTFHAEVFHTDDDDLVLCEIASRCGGIRIGRCNEVTYGINLFHKFAEIQVGLDITTFHNGEDFNPDVLTENIVFNPKKATLSALPTVNPPNWVKEYRLLAKVGETLSETILGVDHYASFVVEGKTEHEVENRIHDIYQWFTQRVQWE